MRKERFNDLVGDLKKSFSDNFILSNFFIKEIAITKPNHYLLSIRLVEEIAYYNIIDLGGLINKIRGKSGINQINKEKCFVILQQYGFNIREIHLKS